MTAASGRGEGRGRERGRAERDEGGLSQQSDSGEGVRTLTAADIAASVHGELVGAPDIAVSAVAPISRATPRDLSFLASARYAPLLTTSEPGVLLVTPELASSPGGARARVIVPKPHDALIDLLPRLYQPRSHTPGVHETARIGRGARLGRQVSIGPYVIIGDGSVIGDRTRLDAHVVIGDGVEVGPDGHLYPGATVYRGASLGARVTLHAGVVVGSDGFGYTFADGAHRKIPHVGRCIIEDDVEVGANATIDRGSIDDTIVGAGTKIDNLVQIGHNVRIGRLCLIMAQVGIAGSTRIGDGVILAGQVGLKGHLEVGDGARLAAQAGVFGDIPAGETWSGYPARPHRESLRASAALMRLSEIIHKLERLVSDRE